MTPFGWIMVVVLVLACLPSEIKPISRMINIFLLIGTLVWGTGSLV